MTRPHRLFATLAGALALSAVATAGMSRAAQRPEPAASSAPAVASPVPALANAAPDLVTPDLLARAVATPRGPRVPGSDYQLERIPVAARVIMQLKDHYVDPTRFQPKEMLVAALEGVERKVAEVMIQGDARSAKLTLTVGAAQRELDISGVNSVWEIRTKLGEAMGLHPGAPGRPAGPARDRVRGRQRHALDPRPAHHPPRAQVVEGDEGPDPGGVRRARVRHRHAGRQPHRGQGAEEHPRPARRHQAQGRHHPNRRAVHRQPGPAGRGGPAARPPPDQGVRDGGAPGRRPPQAPHHPRDDQPRDRLAGATVPRQRGATCDSRSSRPTPPGTCCTALRAQQAEAGRPPRRDRARPAQQPGRPARPGHPGLRPVPLRGRDREDGGPRRQGDVRGPRGEGGAPRPHRHRRRPAGGAGEQQLRLGQRDRGGRPEEQQPGAGDRQADVREGIGAGPAGRERPGPERPGSSDPQADHRPVPHPG